MSETGHHSTAQPAEQHGEDLLQEPRQEEAQVCYLHTPAQKLNAAKINNEWKLSLSLKAAAVSGDQTGARLTC